MDRSLNTSLILYHCLIIFALAKNVILVKFMKRCEKKTKISNENYKEALDMHQKFVLVKEGD